MERADQHEVREVGPAAVPPPHDVMGLGEPAHPAAREPTFPISVPDLADHPRRRLAGHPPQPNDVTRLVFDDRLHAAVTKETTNRLGVDLGTTFDLARSDRPLRVGLVSRREPVELRVDYDGRSIGVGVGGKARRAQRNQPVCAPSVGMERVVLSRHRRNELGHALDRSDHDRALRRGEFGLESQPPPLFQVPPREGPGALGIPFLLDLRVECQVCASPDRAARHVLRPAQ